MGRDGRIEQYSNDMRGSGNNSSSSSESLGAVYDGLEPEFGGSHDELGNVKGNLKGSSNYSRQRDRNRLSIVTAKDGYVDHTSGKKDDIVFFSNELTAARRQ